MAIASWPSTLPQKPLGDGFSEQPPDLVVRSPMDVGLAKMRRRATAGPSRLQMSFLMTATQLATFRSFIADDLQGRVLPFTWMHPLTAAPGTPGTFRIIENPTFTAVANGLAWQVAVVMEQLP